MSNIHLPIAELKPALVGLGKIISRRSTLPVLGMIKIDRTKDGWITLTSTDLDAFVTVRLEEPAKGDTASMLVSHDDLSRITKGCSPGEELVLEPADQNTVRVHYPIGGQTAVAHVQSLPAGDFPLVPKIKGEPVTLPDKLRSSLHAAMQCASDDSTREVLNGAYLDVSGGKDGHHIVATDGRHLYSANSFTLCLAESLIIPNHAFLGWKDFNRDGEWQLRLSQREKQDEPLAFQVSTRRWRFIHKAIEGHYPNWRQILFGAANVKTTVSLPEENLDSLVQLIKRLPEAPKDMHHTLGLKVEKHQVFLCGRNAVDGAWTEVEVHGVKTTGPAVTVFLNREYVARALSFGLHRIELQDALSALQFVGDGSRMVIMPVRVEASPPPSVVPPPPKASDDAHGEPTPPPTLAAAPPTERSNMPKTPPAINGNGHGTEERPTVEAAIEKIETIKGSYREAIQGLNGLSDLLKQVQREQRTTHKEVQSVRTSLEKLQAVRF